jgi:hypothetical protein
MIKSITKLTAVGLLALSLAACATGPRPAETTIPSSATSSTAPNGTIASGEPNGSAAPTGGTKGSKPVLTPPAPQPTSTYQQQKPVDPNSDKGQAYIKRIKSDTPRLAAKSKNNLGLVRNGTNLCSYIALIKDTQKRTPSAAEEADFVVRFYDGGQDKVSKTEAQAVVKATLDTICPEYK